MVDVVQLNQVHRPISFLRVSRDDDGVFPLLGIQMLPDKSSSAAKLSSL